MSEEKRTSEEIKDVIPLNPLRKLIQSCCPYPISQVGIVKLREFLGELTVQVAQNAITEFEKLNENREKQGLRCLSRLNKWAINLSIQNIINHSQNIDLGVQPKRIVYPGGTEMSDDKKAAMPDKNKVEVE